MTNLPIYAAALGAFLIVLQVGLMLTVGIHRTRGQFIGIGEDRDELAILLRTLACSLL